MKKYFLLLALIFAGLTSSHAQITKVLGITGVDDLYEREFVCVFYNKENKAIGALNSNLGITAFNENKINTYAKFKLARALDNSLLLKNKKGYVARKSQGQLIYKSEDYFKKAFERKKDAPPGDPYVIKDRKVRNVFYFKVTDKGKESGYISLDKPMKSEAKLRLYIVK